MKAFRNEASLKEYDRLPDDEALERVKGLKSPLGPDFRGDLCVERLHLQWLGLSEINGLEAFESAEARLTSVGCPTCDVSAFHVYSASKSMSTALGFKSSFQFGDVAAFNCDLSPQVLYLQANRISRIENLEWLSRPTTEREACCGGRLQFLALQCNQIVPRLMRYSLKCRYSSPT